MKFLLVAIAWIISYSRVSALVHYVKLEKTEKGCKTQDGKEILPGDFVQDDKSCGVIVCQNKEGDALIHYCQIPVSFANCAYTSMLTDKDFPECCWMCSSWIDCGSAAKPEDPAAKPEDPAAQPEDPAAKPDDPPAARAPAVPSAITPTTIEKAETRTKVKAGKRSTTKPEEYDFLEGNVNIKFGGGSPISKFGEDSTK
ncbi:uncharacterized protein LOC108112740 [Drosophila eugracilis]|uniref:uncharacterized protein LOC108112740 n=1 Tax=Drosophila eugracilis TaxID=29029 RepID=UPI0007E84F5F|nr:uncharacterized protein LOC108112740 [Drosophila eugracilis]